MARCPPHDMQIGNPRTVQLGDKLMQVEHGCCKNCPFERDYINPVMPDYREYTYRKPVRLPPGFHEEIILNG